MNSDSTARGRAELPSPCLKAPVTHIRWQIAIFLVAIAALTYLDRLNFGIAGKAIQDEFGFSTTQMGWLLSAFVLGYALFQIPGGWLADRIGARRMMTFTVIWWSVFTALTAIAPQLPLAKWFGVAWSFAMVRFLVGVGEAASSPTSSRVVSTWMGKERRGLGSSLTLLGIGIGGTFAPLAITRTMQAFGWRSTFFLCALVGLVVALCWFLDVTDRPEQHPRINNAELELIYPGEQPPFHRAESPARRTIPYARILTSRSAWALSLGYFCQGYPIYIFHTWFFIYLVRVRGLSVLRGGLWDAAPYLAIVILAPLGGWTSDRLSRLLGRSYGRRISVWLGMGGSALLLWTGANQSNVPLALTLLACAAGCNMFAAASWWAATIDLAPESPASLAGFMNTFGNLGGWLAPIGTGYIAVQFGWTAALDVAAIVSLFGAVAWFWVDPSHAIGSDAARVGLG